MLLYWGAEWCPFCHTLKSKVFSRPDFIAKSHLFLPVYLDGDDDGAQKWGEQFGIQGYPTMIVLDPTGTKSFASAPAAMLRNTRRCWTWRWRTCSRLMRVLQAAAGGKALTADECRRAGL